MDLSAENILARIRVVATAASSADRAIVEGIITTAIRSTRTIDLGIVTLSPGACAILFLHMGGYTDGKTLQYARQMAAGDWAHDGSCIGFLQNGQPCDGQHRFAAAALTGIPLVTGITVHEIAHRLPPPKPLARLWATP